MGEKHAQSELGGGEALRQEEAFWPLPRLSVKPAGQDRLPQVLPPCPSVTSSEPLAALRPACPQGRAFLRDPSPAHGWVQQPGEQEVVGPGAPLPPSGQHVR